MVVATSIQDQSFIEYSGVALNGYGPVAFRYCRVFLGFHYDK